MTKWWTYLFFFFEHHLSSNNFILTIHDTLHWCARSVFLSKNFYLDGMRRSPKIGSFGGFLNINSLSKFPNISGIRNSFLYCNFVHLVIVSFMELRLLGLVKVPACKEMTSIEVVLPVLLSVCVIGILRQIHRNNFSVTNRCSVEEVVFGNKVCHIQI